MGNLHLVTGYAGAPHVASSDQGSLYESLIRSGQFVFDAGAKFAASIVSNNQIRVSDGELMMQGRYVKLAPGAYVDLTIENGTQGYLRTDLIVARYTRNADTGIEECSLVVLKGVPAESNPSVPEYTTGNLNAEGALQHDLPLYRVSISGLVLEGLTVLFAPEKSLYDILKLKADADDLEELDAAHNIKSYTTLSQIGLSDDTMSSTDMLSNMVALINAMPSKSELWATLTSSHNIAKSILAKLKVDLGVTSTSYLDACFKKTGGTVLQVDIYPQLYTDSTQLYVYRYSCALRYTADSVEVLSPFIITRNPVGFADAGYGYGEPTTLLSISSGEDTDAALEALLANWDNFTVHQIRISDGNISSYAMIATIYKSSSYVSIVGHSVGVSSGFRKQKIQGVWTPWEWDNPPMIAGTEYRTTERYKGAAVYKKVNASGDVLWRKDGETQWHLLSSASYVAAASVE